MVAATTDPGVSYTTSAVYFGSVRLHSRILHPVSLNQQHRRYVTLGIEPTASYHHVVTRQTLSFTSNQRSTACLLQWGVKRFLHDPTAANSYFCPLSWHMSWPPMPTLFTAFYRAEGVSINGIIRCHKRYPSSGRIKSLFNRNRCNESLKRKHEYCRLFSAKAY